TYNADGLRTGVTEQEQEANNGTSTVTKVWTYDTDQRLTQEAVTVTGATGYNSYVDTYTLDPVGNRVAMTHTTGGTTLDVSYTYDLNDRLTQEQGSSTTSGLAYTAIYGYDDNGSQTSASRIGANPETDGYHFDLRNQLSDATINRMENGKSVSTV